MKAEPMAFVETTAVDGGGEREAVPTTTPPTPAGLIAQVRASVWTPLALRILAVSVGMLALAGIGAASILSGLDGVQVPTDAPLAADIGSAWLALHHDKPPPEHHAHAAPTAASHAAPDAECGDAGAPTQSPHTGITKDGKVVLNVASAEELTKLPGVGMKRAQSIVKLRARLKRFRRASDLLRVRGIGPRGLKRMLPHLVLDPPREGDAGTS